MECVPIGPGQSRFNLRNLSKIVDFLAVTSRRLRIGFVEDGSFVLQQVECRHLLRPDNLPAGCSPEIHNVLAAIEHGSRVTSTIRDQMIFIAGAWEGIPAIRKHLRTSGIIEYRRILQP